MIKIRRTGIPVYSAVSLLLILVASSRIASTCQTLNNTIDEPAHLAAGMEWLEGGVYRYEDQHPPLARAAGAAGLRFAGAHWEHDPDMNREGRHLLAYNHRYDRNLFYARLAMLPFFWVECLVVWLWARKIAGAGAALCSLLIFTTTPAILGHAGLVTTDTALCAFTGAAVLCSQYWAERPTWWRSVVLGLTTGLAILSKFSALPFLAATWALFYGARLLWNRSGAGRQLAEALPRLAVSAFVAALLIWSAYFFSVGQVWYLPWLGNRVPAPAFFGGLWSVWEHNREGHLAYLLGHLSLYGFWYYYPVVLAVKTPIVMFILAAPAFVTAGRRFALALPLALMTGVLAVAMSTHINIGIRHILPLYISFAVCAGVSARNLARGSRLARVALGALLLWQVGSTVAIHPDYIAWTNELAGAHPERILADSDLDWGQSMKALGLRLRELKVGEVSYLVNGFDYLASGNPFPFIKPVPDGDQPPHGWTAISITPWKLRGQPRWPERLEPRERIGHSILLYWFP